MRLKSGLCGGQFMCENDTSCSLTLMCPHAPLFHNESLMNLCIVVLEYAPAIREEKIH